MPTDPQTGKRLPGTAGLYAGEPGAPEGAPPAAGGGRPPIIPERDIPAIADEADRLMLDDALGVVEGALGPTEGMPEEGAVDIEDEGAETAETDMSAIVEALGVDETRAREIYAASQEMPQLQGKPVAEVAMMLAEDIDLRMQVEKLAARAVDMAAEEEMELAGEAMPPGVEGVEGAPEEVI